MDICIVLSGFSAFALFLLLHAAISRATNPEAAIYWLIRIYLLLASLLLVGFGGLEWVIYTLLCILYVFGVFGIIEASITLRLLSEIGKCGKIGITHGRLAARYSIDTIIKRRLKRFLWSGEIERDRGGYRLSRRFSYFLLREYFLDVLRWMYPK